MRTLPFDPIAEATPEALLGFLGRCRDLAREAGRGLVASISVKVDVLDPLAVLESIFEPGEAHFYVERVAESFALAGAEPVLSFEASGPGRFEDCQNFIEQTQAAAVAVGAHAAELGGPLFFCAFSFSDEVETGEAFPAARVFVPRWQVGVSRGATIATANLYVTPESDLLGLAQRVLRAHGKFRSFDYSEAHFHETVPVSAASAEVQRLAVGAPDQYPKSVARALELIGEGRMRKIVLARAEDLITEGGFHPLEALNGLRERFPDCYAFSLANGRGQSFVGASPERLARVSGGRLLTEALAGSARRGATASEDAAIGGALLRDEKELREHGMVLDSIARRLGPLGIAIKTGTGPRLRRLANVQHLHSPVEAEMPAGVGLLEVVARLHPTPAVGGTPREAAVPAIRALEGFPRGLYAGAIGWLNARGEGEFFVGLRSALIDGRRTRIYAGAGIVAGSYPEKEYAETELKLKAMRAALEG